MRVEQLQAAFDIDVAYRHFPLHLAMSGNLVEIVERIGLPGATAHRVLEKRQFRQAVDDDWQRSRALGITAVPTFIVADRGLVGAQPYEQLHSLVSQAGAARRDK